MIFFDGFLGLLAFGVWIYGVIDSITSDRAQVRNLPKAAWVLITILLFWVGALIWFVAGRPREGTPGHAEDVERARAGARTLAPDDDPEYLEMLRRRVDEQRRRSGDTDGDVSA